MVNIENSSEYNREDNINNINNNIQRSDNRFGIFEYNFGVYEGFYFNFVNIF